VRKSWLVSGASAMALGAFGMALGGFSKRWIRPPRVSIDPPACEFFEEIRFPSADGTLLYGWLLGAGADAPGLVLCHGYQRGIEETFSLGFDLRARGFNVLLFDFRGCGKSGGKYTSIGYHEPQDAIGAVRWLRERLGPKAPIGMLGISMGGAVAFTAAAGCPDVRALVTDSAFSTLMGAIQTRFAPLKFPSLQLHHLSMWTAERMCRARARDVRPIDAARRLGDRPVLIIHGTADSIVPFQHAQELNDALTGPHELWALEGVSHAMARFDARDEYLDRVASFFHRHLSVTAGVAA
jgi:uncharacterized protein